MARAEREQAERRITHAVPVQALGLQVRATQLSEVLFGAARAITPSVRAASSLAQLTSAAHSSDSTTLLIRQVRYWDTARLNGLRITVNTK